MSGNFRRFTSLKNQKTDKNMHSEKKLSKEDTWRPADLRRHIRERDHSYDYARRRDENERRHRGGESIERRHRDPEESRHRDKTERERARERGNGDQKDKYVERRKEGSQTRRAETSREKGDERDREKIKLTDNREDRDRKRDREEKRERDKERHKDKEKERLRDGKRHSEEDGDKRRDDRDRERRREERDREHRSERRRHEESGERREHREKQHGEQGDRRHRNYYEDKKRDKDTQERHGDRKHSEHREERDYKEEHRRHKEERELRHKERRHHDEKRKHGSESREHQDLKESAEGFRHSRGDSDRADRDKHRERQKKEEEDAEIRYREKKNKEKGDVERNHRDRMSSKKLSPEESHRHEKKEAVTKEVGMDSEQRTADRKYSGDAEEFVVNDDDLAEQEYEDDFEDYEDDFEEMDENADDCEDEKESLQQEVEDEEKKELTAQRRKEIEAIQRAMAEENERAGTAQSRQSTSREEEDVPKRSRGSEQNKSTSSQRGKFIDFVAAKQREVSQKVATKQKKRSTELRRLIDLDFSMTFCLLDLPPVSEYDMYIRNFGNANTKQAYVQCNEDNADRDIQTEEIEMSEKWTQHPPEHHGACGDPNFSQGARDETRSNMNIDSQRLTSFLRSASQVMVVLLEEDQAERQSLRKLKTQTDSLSFSDGSLQLNTKLPFLYGRQISLVHFSQVQRHTMMSVHMPTAKLSAVRLDSSTIICIWNIWEPSRPRKILVYESEVQCCCFSPRKATLVFAGTSVGSVVLWDLREHANNHYCLKIGEEEWTLRQPTFSTDAVMAASAHFSPVTSVEVVPSTVAGGLGAEVPLLASEEESSGLSFQLASLDESGVLNFWVVVELPKANEAGSPTDLGLRPGGKVKLLHSSSLLTAERSSTRGAEKTWPSQALLLKLHPTDSNHFFIGTSLGLVSHGTSHGVRAPPKFYRFQEGDVRPIDVSSIHFSPFKPHMFLVGCGDGSIRLHTVSREQPVAEWRSSTAGSPVVSLQWAQTRPTVFCVLDAASNLYIWDLSKNDAQPVVTERLNTDGVTAVAMFGDSGQQRTYSGIALAHESGKIELQHFSKKFTVSSCAEEEKLESLITEAF